MKIVKSDESTLVIKDSNSLFVYVIGAIFTLVGIIGIVKPNLYVQAMPIWLSLIFIVAGLAAIMLASSYVTTCNKSTRKVIIAKSSFINKKEVSLGFDDVKSIRVDQNNTYSNGRRMIQTTLYLLLNDGNLVPFSGITAKGGGFGVMGVSILSFSNPSLSSSLEKSLQALSQCIQKPIDIQAPPTIQDVVGAVSKTIQESTKARL